MLNNRFLVLNSRLVILNIRFLTLVISLCLLFSGEVFPQSANESKIRLAETFENNGDFQNSSRLYLELLNANPNNENYLFGYARSLMAMNQFSELLPTMEKYVNIKPSNKLYNLYAEVLWKLGKTNDANTAWNNAIEKYQDNPESYKNTAISQSNLMQFNKAIETLEKARKQYNKKDIFIDELGKLYTAVGDYVNAINEIFAFFEASRNFPQTQGRLQALSFSGDAKKYILESLQAKENSPNRSYKILYAWFLASIGELETSLKKYAEIDNESKAKGAELYTFAIARQKDGQNDIALKAYGMIIDMGKESPYMLNALFGYNRVVENQMIQKADYNPKEYEKLIGRYRNIIDLYPNNNFAFDAQFRIASIYFNNLKEYPKAINELNNLIKLSGNSAQSLKYYNLLGDIYLYIDTLDKANEYFAKTARSNFGGTENDKYYGAYKIAEILYYQGYLDSAKKIYEELATISDANIANDAIEQSFFIEQNKNLLKAIKDYALAEKYQLQNRDSLAIMKYDEVIKYGSGEIIENAILNKASIFVSIGKYKETIDLLNGFIKEFSESINLDKVYFNLGNTYLLNNQPGEAEKVFTNILERFPRTIYLDECRAKIRQIRTRTNS